MLKQYMSLAMRTRKSLSLSCPDLLAWKKKREEEKEFKHDTDAADDDDDNDTDNEESVHAPLMP